jgi:conjugal transfer/entry exclusion protein
MLEIRTDEGNVYDLKKLQKILSLVYNADYVMELKCAVALELLGERYQTIKQHSKANFAKSVDTATLQMVMENLQQEGLLSRKGLASLEKK